MKILWFHKVKRLSTKHTTENQTIYSCNPKWHRPHQKTQVQQEQVDGWGKNVIEDVFIKHRAYSNVTRLYWQIRELLHRCDWITISGRTMWQLSGWFLGLRADMQWSTSWRPSLHIIHETQTYCAARKIKWLFNFDVLKFAIFISKTWRSRQYCSHHLISPYYDFSNIIVIISEFVRHKIYFYWVFMYVALDSFVLSTLTTIFD